MVKLQTDFSSQQISASFWCNMGQNFLECSFFWGYMKNRIFATLIADVEELKARSQAAVYTVTVDMLETLGGVPLRLFPRYQESTS